MPRADEQTIEEYKQIITSDVRSRDAIRQAEAAGNKALALHIYEAKTKGVPHGMISDWLGMTRDGLTKFLNRHLED
jgi:hypothetical protein